MKWQLPKALQPLALKLGYWILHRAVDEVAQHVKYRMQRPETPQPPKPESVYTHFAFRDSARDGRISIRSYETGQDLQTSSTDIKLARLEVYRLYQGQLNRGEDREIVPERVNWETLR